MDRKLIWLPIVGIYFWLRDNDRDPDYWAGNLALFFNAIYQASWIVIVLFLLSFI